MCSRRYIGQCRSTHLATWTGFQEIPLNNKTWATFPPPNAHIMPYRQALLALLALPIAAVLLRAPPKPSRETVVAPTDERVVLLGASSGVGKDLALAYAKRGARM